MRVACLLVASCVLGACTHAHDYEIDARNVSNAPIAMQVRHVGGSGASRVAFDTQIDPGTSSYYLYQARQSTWIAACEATFAPAGDADGAGVLMTIEHGVPAIVDVDEQDGRVVVTDRRPE